MAFGINAVLGFLTVSLIVRAFGLEAQGLVAFSKLFTTSGYLALFCLGLPTIIMRKVAFYRGRNHDQMCSDWVSLGLAASLLLATPIALLAMALYYVEPVQQVFCQLTGLHLFNTELQGQFILLVMMTIPFQFVGMISQSILFGLQDFAEIRISEIGTTVFNLFAVIVFWFFHWQAERLALTVIFFELARAFYLTFFVLQRFPISKMKLSAVTHLSADFKQELKVSFFSSLMAFLDNNAILYVAAQVLGPAGLGLYDSLSKISRILKTAFGLVTSALMPHAISTEAAKGQGRVVKIYHEMSFIVGFFMIPPITLLVALSPLILKLWLGANFVQYWPLLAVGFLTTLALVLISMQGSFFSSRREVIVDTSIVNFFENLIGLPLLYWMCLVQSVEGLFVNRLLVVWIGLIPRALVVTKHYQYKLMDTVKVFRWSFVVSSLVCIFLMYLYWHWQSMVLSIISAVLLLALSWVLIYQKSNIAEKALVSKTINEILALLPKNIQQRVRRFSS